MQRSTWSSAELRHLVPVWLQAPILSCIPSTVGGTGRGTVQGGERTKQVLEISCIVKSQKKEGLSQEPQQRAQPLPPSVV